MAYGSHPLSPLHPVVHPPTHKHTFASFSHSLNAGKNRLINTLYGTLESTRIRVRTPATQYPQHVRTNGDTCIQDTHYKPQLHAYAPRSYTYNVIVPNKHELSARCALDSDYDYKYILETMGPLLSLSCSKGNLQIPTEKLPKIIIPNGSKQLLPEPLHSCTPARIVA